MQHVLIGLAALAAVMFLLVSGTANSLFLSSLGKTALEVALLAALSIASDLAKAILPVVIMRAVMLRAWVLTGLASFFLAAAISLSLVSGLGFAATARSVAEAARDGGAAQLAARKATLADLQRERLALPASRPTAIIRGDLQAAIIDRRWGASKDCTAPQGREARLFCSQTLKLYTELATAEERVRLSVRIEHVLREIEALQAGGGSVENDPQVAVLAGLSGLGTAELKLGLTLLAALVLELGSVVLVLLVASRVLWGWKEPGEEAPAPAVPVAMPAQADRSHWQKQRAGLGVGGMNIGKGIGGDANAR